MKKGLNVLAIITLLLVISCSNDDIEGNSESTRSLTLVKKETYLNNNLRNTLKYNFYQDKLIRIQSSNNQYEEVHYQGDLVSQILEFDRNNNLQWTTTFKYDDSNRLIQKN